MGRELEVEGRGNRAVMQRVLRTKNQAAPGGGAVISITDTRGSFSRIFCSQMNEAEGWSKLDCLDQNTGSATSQHYKLNCLSKLINFCMPQYLQFKKKSDVDYNSTYFIGILYRLNNIVCAKLLELYLAHRDILLHQGDWMKSKKPGNRC